MVQYGKLAYFDAESHFLDPKLRAEGCKFFLYDVQSGFYRYTDVPFVYVFGAHNRSNFSDEKMQLHTRSFVRVLRYHFFVHVRVIVYKTPTVYVRINRLVVREFV